MEGVPIGTIVGLLVSGLLFVVIIGLTIRSMNRITTRAEARRRSEVAQRNAAVLFVRALRQMAETGVTPSQAQRAAYHINKGLEYLRLAGGDFKPEPDRIPDILHLRERATAILARGFLAAKDTAPFQEFLNVTQPLEKKRRKSSVA